jgi:hypothetical protein
LLPEQQQENKMKGDGRDKKARQRGIQISHRSSVLHDP